MFFFQAQKLLPAFLLILLILCPVLSGEEPGDTAGEGDFLDEELFFVEEEGITVVETQETTQQIKTITKEEIERFHAPDLPTLLEQALDLGTTRYGPYGNQGDINIRGFDSERIAVLVDGVPVNSAMSGDFDFNMIGVDSIERIEVVYGGSDTKYNVSGALGGIINIITVKKQKPGLRVGGSFSNTSALPGKYYNRDGAVENPAWQDLLDTQNITLFAGMGGEGFSWSANWFGNRAANHYLYKNSYGTIRRKEHNEVWDTGAAASFVWDLPDYAKLIASGDFYYGNRNFPLTAGSSIFGDQKDLSFRQNIMLDMPRIFRDDLATQLSLSHTWRKRDYIGPGSTPSQHDEQALAVINRWDWYPLAELTLRIGVDYRYSHLNSTNTGIRGRHDSGAYFTLEYKPSTAFLIIPSVKVVSDGHAIVPIPKLGLVWSPLDFFSVKNNYYRSFKFPDLEDLYWEGLGYSGNPDLEPEDGWGGDLGISYQYKNYLTLESTFFVQWTDNSIHWSGDSGGKWRPQNVGAALFFGSENKIGISPFKDMALKTSGVFLRDAALSLSYQFLLGRLLSYGYSWGSDKRIPYMPMHTLGISLDIPWGLGKDGRAGSVVVSGHFEAARFTDTANVKKLPPHFLLNININQEIRKNLAAFLAVRNVLNSSYQSFDSYPMPGVTFTLGVKVNYEKN